MRILNRNRGGSSQDNSNRPPEMAQVDGQTEEAVPSSSKQPDWAAIQDAQAFLEEFIAKGWEEQQDNIRIQCDITIQELYSFGSMDQAAGTEACRRLVRVPFINDEIGFALWKRLAGDIQGPEFMTKIRTAEEGKAQEQVEEWRKRDQALRSGGLFEVQKAEGGCSKRGDGRQKSRSLTRHMSDAFDFLRRGSNDSSSSEKEADDARNTVHVENIETSGERSGRRFSLYPKQEQTKSTDPAGSNKQAETEVSGGSRNKAAPGASRDASNTENQEPRRGRTGHRTSFFQMPAKSVGQAYSDRREENEAAGKARSESAPGTWAHRLRALPKAFGESLSLGYGGRPYLPQKPG